MLVQKVLVKKIFAPRNILGLINFWSENYGFRKCNVQKNCGPNEIGFKILLGPDKFEIFDSKSLVKIRLVIALILLPRTNDLRTNVSPESQHIASVKNGLRNLSIWSKLVH